MIGSSFLRWDCLRANAGRVCRIAAVVAFAAVLSPVALPALAQEGAVARYAAGSIASEDMADAALADVARERAQVEARFAQEEAECYDRFFATACTEAAKERRRDAMQQLRRVEIEANAFKRRSRAEQRDADLARRQAEEQAKLIERQAPPKPNERADAMQLPQERQRQGDEGNAQASGPTERELQHAARMKQLQEEEQRKAAERAENAAAYERKVQEAKRRQEEVARRKAEKEERRRAKEAEAAAAAK